MADRYSPQWITITGLVELGASFLVFSARGGDIQHGGIISGTVKGRIELGLILLAEVAACFMRTEKNEFRR